MEKKESNNKKKDTQALKQKAKCSQIMRDDLNLEANIARIRTL